MEAILDYPLLMLGGAAAMAFVGKQMGGFLGSFIFKVAGLIMSVGAFMAILMYSR